MEITIKAPMKSHKEPPTIHVVHIEAHSELDSICGAGSTSTAIPRRTSFVQPVSTLKRFERAFAQLVTRLAMVYGKDIELLHETGALLKIT